MTLLQSTIILCIITRLVFIPFGENFLQSLHQLRQLSVLMASLWPWNTLVISVLTSIQTSGKRTGVTKAKDG